MEAQMEKTKKRSNAIVTMTEQGELLVFDVHGAGKLTLDLTKVHPDNRDRAVVRGFKQRIADAAAIPCDPETGLPASPQIKFEHMSRLTAHYNSGAADWNLTRATGEGAGLAASKTLTAIMNVYKLEGIEAARAYVEKTAVKRGIEYGEALALWRSSDKIREELARMAAAAPTKVNADALLGELS
jgi:hypothetical protein